MKKKLTKKETLKLETIKMREIVIRLLREFADQDKSIGFADPNAIRELVSNLENDPSGWFAAGMQLMQVGLISLDHWEILQGIQKKITTK